MWLVVCWVSHCLFVCLFVLFDFRILIVIVARVVIVVLVAYRGRVGPYGAPGQSSNASAAACAAAQLGAGVVGVRPGGPLQAGWPGGALQVGPCQIRPGYFGRCRGRALKVPRRPPRQMVAEHALQMAVVMQARLAEAAGGAAFAASSEWVSSSISACRPAAMCSRRPRDSASAGAWR